MDTSRYVEKYLHVEGGRITYFTAGSPANPPVMLVHGWLSSRHLWRTTVEVLKETHYCIALDLLGLGDSDKPAAADYSTAAQGRRVLALADALGIDRFTLMGHSMGGQIALYIAAKLAPQRIIKLVHIDGVVSGKLMPAMDAITKPFIWLAGKLPVLYPITRWFVQFEAIYRLMFRVWFHDMSAVSHEFVKPDIRTMLQSAAYRTNDLTGKPIAQTDMTPFLAEIQAPTLIIFGDDDGVVPVPEANVAAKGIPNAKLVIVPACGHLPMFEKQKEFFAALKSFL